MQKSIYHGPCHRMTTMSIDDDQGPSPPLTPPIVPGDSVGLPLQVQKGMLTEQICLPSSHPCKHQLRALLLGTALCSPRSGPGQQNELASLAQGAPRPAARVSGVGRGQMLFQARDGRCCSQTEWPVGIWARPHEVSC